MGNLIIYSDIVTKIKAMERWRIKDEQLKRMASLEIVPEAAECLRRFLPYREILQETEGKDLHRGDIEQRFNLSQYRDFAKLYKFVNIRQRHFLDLYFMHYGIAIIKIRPRNAVGRREQRQDLSMLQDFSKRHSSIDLITLSQSPSITEFVGNLKGSPYYELLDMMLRSGTVSLPAFEMTLDMLYLKITWKIKDKYLSKEERKILAQCLGTKMDTLNLEWLCRPRKFYKLPPGEIYVIMIPVQLHLIENEINKTAEAEILDQLYGLIRSGWYGGPGLVSHLEEPDLDRLIYEIIDRVYQMIRGKDPYSIVIPNSYLYFKGRKIAHIINTTERIRHSLAAN